MNNKAPTRIDIISGVRLPGTNAGLLFSLVAGSAIGVTVAGSSKGLEGFFLDLLTISSLILFPICMKRTGYRLALGIAAITIPTLIVTLLSRSVYALISSEGIAIALWAMTQIAVAKFAYGAYKGARDSEVHLLTGGNSFETPKTQDDVLEPARLEADVQVGVSSLEGAGQRELLAA